jgi:hypothetical protein
MKNEWESEEDVYKWETNGFECLILRQETGHLCGYVAVPKGHKLCGVTWLSYTTDSGYPDIHGGINYTSFMRNDESKWWIGFDCAHGGDLIPGHTYASNGIYRNVAYVRNECLKLALMINNDEIKISNGNRL